MISRHTLSNHVASAIICKSICTALLSCMPWIIGHIPSWHRCNTNAQLSHWEISRRFTSFRTDVIRFNCHVVPQRRVHDVSAGFYDFWLEYGIRYKLITNRFYPAKPLMDEWYRKTAASLKQFNRELGNITTKFAVGWTVAHAEYIIRSWVVLLWK